MNSCLHNRIPTLLLALALCVSIAPCAWAAEDSLSRYRDIDQSAWYYKGVRYCIEKGIMSGYGNLNRYFEPDELMSRAALAAVLWRMDGAPKTGFSLRFDDVQEGIWYEEAVRWAAINGIMNAETPSTFGTEQPVKREQFAMALWHYADYRNGFVPHISDPEFEGCSDRDMTSPEAVDAMHWASALGVITSAKDKSGRSWITPQVPVSRSAAAAILMRFSLDLGIYD